MEIDPAEPFDLQKYLHEGERIVHNDFFIYLTEQTISKGDESERWLRAYFNPSVRVFGFNDTEEVLELEEYRFGNDEFKWGLPGGGVDKNESPQEAAAREFHEESGYRAGSMKYFCSIPITGKTINDLHIYFVAKNLTYEPVVNPDGDVIRKTRFTTVPDLKTRVLSGELDWSMDAFAILQLARAVENFDQDELGLGSN